MATAHIFARELPGVYGYLFQSERFAAMRTPTLMILGGDSPPQFGATTEAVNASLPDSRIIVMPGQQHNALVTGPDTFTDVVLTFLLENDVR